MEDQDAVALLPSVVRFGSAMNGPRRLAWQVKGSHSALDGKYVLCAASCTLAIVCAACNQHNLRHRPWHAGLLRCLKSVAASCTQPSTWTLWSTQW